MPTLRKWALCLFATTITSSLALPLAADAPAVVFAEDGTAAQASAQLDTNPLADSTDSSQTVVTIVSPPAIVFVEGSVPVAPAPQPAAPFGHQAPNIVVAPASTSVVQARPTGLASSPLYPQKVDNIGGGSASQHVQPAQSAQPVQPVQHGETDQSQQSSQSVQPVQSDQSDQSSQSIQPVQPIQPIQPIQSIQPVRPIQPVQPVGSTYVASSSQNSTQISVATSMPPVKAVLAPPTPLSSSSSSSLPSSASSSAGQGAAATTYSSASTDGTVHAKDPAAPAETGAGPAPNIVPATGGAVYNGAFDSVVPCGKTLKFVSQLQNLDSSETVNAYVAGTEPGSGRSVFLDPTTMQWISPLANGPGAPKDIGPQIAIDVRKYPTFILPGWLSSARVYYAVGTLHFGVMTNGATPGCSHSAGGCDVVSQPSFANPTDPDANVNWGFAELDWSEAGGLWIDLSYVDFVGIPIGMKVDDEFHAGLPPNAADSLCTQLSDPNSALIDPSENWGKLCQTSPNGKIHRVIAPYDYMVANNDALKANCLYDDYVEQVWARYTKEPLFMDSQDGGVGTLSCMVQPNMPNSPLVCTTAPAGAIGTPPSNAIVSKRDAASTSASSASSTSAASSSSSSSSVSALSSSGSAASSSSSSSSSSSASSASTSSSASSSSAHGTSASTSAAPVSAATAASSSSQGSSSSGPASTSSSASTSGTSAIASAATSSGVAAASVSGSSTAAAASGTSGAPSSGESAIFYKPTSHDIFGCNSGPFANIASNSAMQASIIPRLCAAFTRSTLLLANGNQQPGWGDADFYNVPKGVATNHYSRIVHDLELDGKGYAFAYDDVAPGPTDADPEPGAAAGLIATPNPNQITFYVGGMTPGSLGTSKSTKS